MLSLLLLCVPVHAGIRYFYSDYDSIEYEESLHSRVSLFTREEAPWGGRTPYLGWNLDLTGSSADLYFIDVIWYHSSLKELFQGDLRGQVDPQSPFAAAEYPDTLTGLHCCTEERAEAGVCTSVGRPIWDVYHLGFPSIVEDSQARALWDAKQVYVGGAAGLPGDESNSSASPFRLLSDSVPVTQSGFYHVHYINCHEDTTAYFEGQLEWMNPHGHLPASNYAYLPLNICLTVVYFALALMNGFLCWMYRTEVKKVQLMLQVLLMVAFFEYFLYAIDWSVYNFDTGEINLFLNILTMIMYAVRSVAFLLVFLVVAMGWQIWRPTLSPERQLLFMGYGGCMFLFTFLYALLDLFRYTPQLQHVEVPMAVMVLMGVPMALLDLGCVLWIGFELVHSARVLERGKQTQKEQLYRSLTKILAGCTIVGCLLFVIEQSIALAGLEEDLFRTFWLFGAVWTWLALAATLAVWWHLRPSMQNNVRLAFQEIADDGYDGEGDAAAVGRQGGGAPSVAEPDTVEMHDMQEEEEASRDSEEGTAVKPKRKRRTGKRTMSTADPGPGRDSSEEEASGEEASSSEGS